MGTINGEAAAGKGQILSGNAGNAATDGLILQITATSAGSLGNVHMLDGIANAAQRTLNNANDPRNGPIQGEKESLQQGIQDMQGVIDAAQASSTRREAALRTKFNQLESTMALLQSQSSELSSQIAKL
jgi:flagellar capping protein FliD